MHAGEVTIAEVSPPAWESAGSYSAASDRMTLSALLAPGPAPGPFAPWGGVKPSNLDTGMSVTALGTPAMFVQVNTGTCYVPAAIQANSGWICHNNGQRQCVIGAANATNPRIDLIVAHVYDAVDDSGTLNTWQLEVVPGTPAASPAVPAAPTNSIPLAQVTVPANASSVVGGNIADVRTWEVALGGVLPVGGLAAVPAGYTGMYVHDRSSGRLLHNPPAGPVQPHLLPAAPVMASSTAQQNEGGTTEVTSLSVSFTADGVTDWEVYYKVGSVQATSGSNPFRVWIRLYLDNVLFDSIITATNPADSSSYSGVAVTSFLSAAMGNRPSAGAHTVKVTFQTTAVFGVALNANSGQPIILRAKPVCL